MIENLKPFIKYLISFYYNELENVTGGYLHIALDDGNVSHYCLDYCQEEALKNGDTFGYFLATLMMQFTEDELEEIYEDHHWGMEQ